MILNMWQVLKQCTIIIGILLLVACGSTEDNSQGNDIGESNNVNDKINEQRIIVPEPDLTSRQRLSKAVKSLEQGQADIAEVELVEYQKTIPSSKRASNLLRQIRTPSEEYFPSDFFTIELRSGQSLSTLAKKYIGTAWEFYALAKYNKIENPSRVNIGSEIKIPLTQLAKSVVAADEKATLEKSNETEQAAINIEQEPAEMIQADGGIIDIVDEVSALTPDDLIALIDDANQANDFTKAYALLSQFLEQEEMTSQVKVLAITTYRGYSEAVRQSDPMTSAQAYLALGQLYSESKEELLAFESFKQASLVDVNNEEAAIKRREIQANITEKYHREASVAFRQQKLDKAIAKWDIVLDVDPNHSNASAYRTQALELKKRLEAIQE